METTEIILAVISLIGVVLTGVIIPFIKSKLNTEQLDVLNYWTNVLIAAAETEFKGEKMGTLKKEWVLNQLELLGLKFDREAVSIAVDGLCRDLTSKGVINDKEVGV